MQRPRRLPALTGLRFFVAVGVLLFHYFPSTPPWWLPLRAWAARGRLGVPVFFLLSGFVLAYNYFPMARTQCLDAADFWLARFARIYPAYAAAFALQGIWMLRTYHRIPLETLPMLSGGVASVALAQSWVERWVYIWNGPGWTLSVEAFFYLVFPALAGLRNLSRRRAWLLAGAMALLSMPVMTDKIPFNSLPLLWLPLFTLGIALARLHELDALPHWQARLATPAALASLAVTAVPQLSRAWIGCLSLPLFALLILGLAPGRGLCARLLARPAVEALGEASYALYILQLPLWEAGLMARHHGWFPSQWPPRSLPFFLTYLAVAIGVSLGVHRWFEAPLRRGIRRRWGAERAGMAAYAQGNSG